jgi:predicted nucleic acid-binding protein
VRPAPLILDTGGWLFALAGDAGYAQALREARPAIVPGLVLAEVDWHLRKRRSDMRRLMKDLAAGAYTYEPPTSADLARATQIDNKFSDLGLGLVDATVAALAERQKIFRVLTTDRDLAVVRVGRGFRQALELAVPLPA